jgi:hypothetical protein
MRPVALSRGWAFDTNTKLSRESAHAILHAPFVGAPRVAIGRYLSLGAPSPSDLSIQERDDIFDAGWPAIFLVQHVNYPDWQADSRLGTQHGQAAARHAQIIEAPFGVDISPDIEGLGNGGAAAYDYLCYWADAVRYLGYEVTDALVANPPGYSVRPYDGYDDGLAWQYKSLLLTRGIVAANKWWSDFGPRTLPPPEVYSMKQHAQIMLGGVSVDPDEILLDNVVIAMAPDAPPGAP